MLRSPQWHGDHFENPPSWPKRAGLGAVLRWRLTPGLRGRPRDYHPPTVTNDGSALRDNHGGVSITWIGHATTLIQGGGMSILTDPIFSERISGFFRRMAPAGVRGWDLPRIDVVVISHNHRDHLDEDSVRALGPRTTYVVPLGLGLWFKKRGLTRVIELDWWETTEIVGPRGGHVVLTMVPAQHWSARLIADQDKSLWGGYVIDAGGRRFYFAGDTGYPAAFRQIGERFPDLDYALLPIGAYAPRWFMRPQHMSPEDAALAFRELHARTLVPIHWGTFHLSDEPMAEPPVRLRAAMGDEADRILQLAIGETWFEPPPEPPSLPVPDDAGTSPDAPDGGS
jgi:L-ascorbate metabolism protein UlaG (beta-lactamase superfamily)